MDRIGKTYITVRLMVLRKYGPLTFSRFNLHAYLCPAEIKKNEMNDYQSNMLTTQLHAFSSGDCGSSNFTASVEFKCHMSHLCPIFG